MSLGVILTPTAFSACAIALQSCNGLKVEEYSYAEVQELCASDRAWIEGQVGVLACLDSDERLVRLADGMPEAMRSDVLTHEAAHLCGWPSDHPGEWEVRYYDYEP